MWVQLNHRLKRHAPSLHSWLKRRADAWHSAPDPRVPVLRCIRGEFFWVHPRLLALDTRDSEPHICEWVLSSLRPGSTFFDVGAHYGWISLKAARRVGRNGRVIAFEPSPAALQILRYNQKKNRLLQMEVVDGAVSDTDGELSFYVLDGGASWRNSLVIGRSGLPFLEGASKTSCRVPSVRLDAYCNATGLAPHVIKIDVEGGEGMVLRGATQVLRRLRPVLVLSMHPYWLPPEETVEGILDGLASCGYHIKDSHLIRFQGYEIGDYLLSC